MTRNFGWIVMGVVLGIVALSLPASSAGGTGRYWVFLRDKNIPAVEMASALRQVERDLTPAARHRREIEMSPIVDHFDLPVSSDYVAAIRRTGVRIRHVSRWLNAASIEATPSQCDQLRRLSCVDRVEPFRLRGVIEPLRPVSSLDFDYGPSYSQNALCRVPELHDRGLSGQGVLMCILDTGARLDHHAFDSLDVVATYDFIFGDTIVSNQEGQDSAGQHYHGTATLSAMAGFQDGTLIGPAYGASVLVAKTEWTASETPIEEDYYVAGLEWADSLGARITSSSLGYIDWYTFEDMDGHTAVTTIGVNVAVSRGILVVTAAGNERQNDWGHIIAPADADSILAVGAVDEDSVLAGFSSPGPTYDGRIKPDVCAMGVATYCADASGTSTYWALSGTSLSTPIVAGIAALVMEAHPNWTAQMVRTAMMSTASNHLNPNNDFGWGIVDAVQAADFEFTGIQQPGNFVPSSLILVTSFPNPTNGAVSIQLRLPVEEKGSLALFDLLGRQVYGWPSRVWNAGETEVTLDATALSTGMYIARFSGAAGEAAAKVVILK